MKAGEKIAYLIATHSALTASHSAVATAHALLYYRRLTLSYKAAPHYTIL